MIDNILTGGHEAEVAALKESVKELRACLQIAYRAFAHDDEGPVWADWLIASTERILKATADAEQKKNKKK